MPNDDLESLASVSRALGERIDYAQGGGGNTSFKVNDRKMWVKASGLPLSTVTATSGFSAVDNTALCANLDSCHDRSFLCSMHTKQSPRRT